MSAPNFGDSARNQNDSIILFYRLMHCTSQVICLKLTSVRSHHPTNQRRLLTHCSACKAAARDTKYSWLCHSKLRWYTMVLHWNHRVWDVYIYIWMIEHFMTFLLTCGLTNLLICDVVCKWPINKSYGSILVVVVVVLQTVWYDIFKMTSL